jgi:hypothetical protein
MGRAMSKRQASCAGGARLLLGLEVVEEDAALLGLLAPVLDDDARAVDDLAGVAFTIDLACSHKVLALIQYQQPAFQDTTYTDQPTRRAACHQGP